MNRVQKIKEQKTAIITGGSSGIGKSLVFKFASEGYIVIFTGRDSSRLKEVEKALHEKGHTYVALAMNVASEDANKELIQQVVDRFGRIDVLICNAGISQRALFEDMNIEVFKQLMDVNFYGAVYGVKYAIPHLLKSKGAIIGISSINGKRATPARSAYSSSKYAMQGFFESLRTELMMRGVRVLVVCPGFTASNIRNVALDAQGKNQGESPRKEQKMMSSETVAKKTFHAFKKGKRDLVLTAEGKMAVILNKLIPSTLDKIVYRMMKKEPGSPLK